MLSLALHSELPEGVLRHKPVVLENTPVLDHLHQDPGNIPSVVNTTVFSSFKPHSQALQHVGQVATLHLVETAKQFSDIDPLGGKLGERHTRQDTLRE